MDTKYCRTCTTQVEARVAIVTTITIDNNLTTKIYWDERDTCISKHAKYFCKEHGIQFLTNLAKTLID